MSVRLLLLALVLLAAAPRLDLMAPLDPEVFQRNLERWRAMDRDERATLEARWDQFQQLPETRRDELRRRLGALRRLHRDHREEHGVEPAPTELAGALSRVEERARVRLAVDERSDVRREVQRHTARRARAFLDSLAREGRLTVEERDRIVALPLGDRVRECLELRKRDQLDLYSGLELARSMTALEALDPLEAIDAMRAARRERGFLGAAGRLIELDDAERAAIAAAIDADRLEEARAALLDDARELLEREGVKPEVLESTLAMPFAQLERRLHRLLRVRLEDATRPAGPSGAASAPSGEAVDPDADEHAVEPHAEPGAADSLPPRDR